MYPVHLITGVSILSTKGIPTLVLYTSSLHRLNLFIYFSWNYFFCKYYFFSCNHFVAFNHLYSSNSLIPVTSFSSLIMLSSLQFPKCSCCLSPHIVDYLIHIVWRSAQLSLHLLTCS